MFRKSREKSPYFLAAVDFGYTLLASLIIFGWIGWWIDGKYHTTPLFLIGGIFLGLAVGFSSLFRRIGAIDKSQRAAKNPKKQEPHDPEP